MILICLVKLDKFQLNISPFILAEFRFDEIKDLSEVP